MKNQDIKIFLVIVAVVAFMIALALPSFAKQEDKIYWCHTEPNGNFQTLHLPPQALENAGHVDAKGNPLHADDHAGECQIPEVTLTPTPTNTPEATSTATPSLSPSLSPTPSPTATLTNTPAIEPTVTPTGIPSNTPTPNPTNATANNEEKQEESKPQPVELARPLDRNIQYSYK